jgi:tRNA-2-methylthio-N6-dimethylallyladenosine synthase
VGDVQEVLVEGRARKGEGMFMGRTRGYRKVVFPGKDRLMGELLDIRITSASVSILKGDPILNSTVDGISKPALAESL